MGIYFIEKTKIRYGGDLFYWKSQNKVRLKIYLLIYLFILFIYSWGFIPFKCWDKVWLWIYSNEKSQNKAQIGIYSVSYFSIFNNIRPQSYLILVFSEDQNHNHTFFWHLKKKLKPQPHLILAFPIKSQQYVISAFSIDKNSSSTLFLFCQHYKTLAVPYFSIFNRIKPQQYFVIAFSIEKYPSLTLFLLFEQYKTPAVP